MLIDDLMCTVYIIGNCTQKSINPHDRNKWSEEDLVRILILTGAGFVPPKGPDRYYHLVTRLVQRISLQKVFIYSIHTHDRIAMQSTAIVGEGVDMDWSGESLSGIQEIRNSSCTNVWRYVKSNKFEPRIRILSWDQSSSILKDQEIEKQLETIRALEKTIDSLKQKTFSSDLAKEQRISMDKRFQLLCKRLKNKEKMFNDLQRENQKLIAEKININSGSASTPTTISGFMDN
jgi:hypothetical protein